MVSGLCGASVGAFGKALVKGDGNGREKARDWVYMAGWIGPSQAGQGMKERRDETNDPFPPADHFPCTRKLKHAEAGGSSQEWMMMQTTPDEPSTADTPSPASTRKPSMSYHAAPSRDPSPPPSFDRTRNPDTTGPSGAVPPPRTAGPDVSRKPTRGYGVGVHEAEEYAMGEMDEEDGYGRRSMNGSSACLLSSV